MKKPLFVAFTVCLAASARAALMISVDGVIDPPAADVELQPGETAVIAIHGDGSMPSPWDCYLFVEGPGSIDGHTMLYPGSLSSYDDLEAIAESLEMSVEDTLAAFRDFIHMPELQDLSFINLADEPVPPAPLDALLVDDIIFRCSGVGDVTLTLFSCAFVPVYSTQTIHQVPEPMTLLLLGLGGLFTLAGRGRQD